ncbi:MAG: WG repeat-containing protein [Bacilli bacterium]|nr:WG repeat-containing protein [Bacilli bacterium]
MLFFIKKKLVDGKIKYGIIDENLKEVLPFDYNKIEEKMYTYYNEYYHVNESKIYYVLTDEKDKQGIFAEGKLILEPSYDYAELLPITNSSWIKFVVGNKVDSKMEYGILLRSPAYKGDFKYTMIYPFGKADWIKWENNKIILYKNISDKVLVGLFNDPEWGTFDPQYTHFNMLNYTPSVYPLMPDPKKMFADKNAQWFFDHLNSCWDIKYAKASILKNEKELTGVLVQTKKEAFEELIPCEYDDCKIYTKDNLITVSKTKDKKLLKGLFGYATYWNAYTRGALVSGNCTFIEEFFIPCEYDDIYVLCDESKYNDRRERFYILIKNGKCGLIKVDYSVVRGSYDEYGNNRNPKATVEVMLDCEYDGIAKLQNTNSFVFSEGENKGLLVYDKCGKNIKSLKTDCKYKKIKTFTSGQCYTLYEMTDFDDKKSIFTTRYEQECYEFINTPFADKYDIYGGLIKSSKTIEGLVKHDIYNRNLDLIASNIDTIEQESKLYKITTKPDDNNTRIVYTSKEGRILFDEQGDNISSSYCDSLQTFFLSNNDILKVINPKTNIQQHQSKNDIQGDYISFDLFEGRKLILYKRASEDSKYGVYKFTSDGWPGAIILSPLLKAEYESVKILNNNRSIVSKIIENNESKIKYGVVENNQANECIPLEYDLITLEKNENGREIFVANNNLNGITEQTIFDTDGFFLERNIIEKDIQKTLTLSKKKL